ncbi:liprin-alpha-1-like [Prionailurus viverrinus]|uniref:liprin-alpha-1-like n=1 Tax=Prionailurus viverrinus TaxID=61388 RepID=UPI001FF6AD29|nr:liprin-alpha-1-like [Prionailurus viverrinus]
MERAFGSHRGHGCLLSAEVLVWRKDPVIRWVLSIGLKEEANNRVDGGVHGTLMALDGTFDVTALALLVQIPTQNTQVTPGRLHPPTALLLETPQPTVDQNRQLQERLEVAERRLQQTPRKAKSLPEVEAEPAQRVATLCKVGPPFPSGSHEAWQHGRKAAPDGGPAGGKEPRTAAGTCPGGAAAHLAVIEDEAQAGGVGVRQREKLKEETNQHLSSTIDKLLYESDKRLQRHLKERMAAAEDKDHLLRNFEALRAVLKRARVRGSSLHHGRTHVGSIPASRFRLADSPTDASSSSSSSTVLRRHRKGRVARLRHEPSKLLPLEEESQDSTARTRCVPSAPSSQRSLSLDRLQQGALHKASHEDIRDATKSPGSRDGPLSSLSKTSNSQDSLNNAPKKKGITKSIRWLLTRRQKVHPSHASDEPA